MKKIKLNSLIVLLIALLVVTFIGCGKDDPDKEEQLDPIKVLVPSGAPLIALGNLLDNDAFDIEVSNGADPLSAALMGNDYDIVIAPLNLGAKLNTLDKTSFKIDSIITVNNTYLVSKNKLDSVEDLKNIKVLAYGQNATPDIVLKVANKKYELGMTMSYLASANDVMQMFAANSSDAEYILSAYPQVTVLKNKGLDINIIDVAGLFEDSIFPQACLYVNKAKDIDFEPYLKMIENNINLLNREPEKYAKDIVNKNVFFSGLGEKVLAEAIPNTNIVYKKAIDNKEAINQYVDYLNEYAPKLLNGKTVNEDFYN